MLNGGYFSAPRGILTAIIATHQYPVITQQVFRTSREVNDARWPHTCSRPSAFEARRQKTKKKKHKNPASPKTHHDIHSSPVAATTSRRLTTKHVPRVNPYSPASIDSKFVEIGLVQLSQSVKTTTYTQTDRQTDGHTDRQTD